MKFLSKLFGRGSEDEAVAAELAEAEVVETEVHETTEPKDPSSSAVPSTKVESDPATAVVSEPAEAFSAEVLVPNEPEQLSSALGSEPRRQDLHQAVAVTLPEVSERLSFYQRLSQDYSSEPYHSLSLGRAYRDAGQLRESVGHYQQYLRSDTEVSVLEELAEVFEQLGDSYMANSSRMVASTLRNKG